MNSDNYADSSNHEHLEQKTSHPLAGADDIDVDELFRDAVCVKCGTHFRTVKPERRYCVWCQAAAEIADAKARGDA